MIIPDFEKLYEPYAGKASLDQTLAWMQKKSKELGISETVMNEAVADTFLEMAAGKTFPTDGGNTGFTGYPHAVLNHYLLAKMIQLNASAVKSYRESLEGVVKARMLSHIEAENQKFIADNTKPPKPFFDWSRSETVRLYKKIRGK